MNIPFGISKSAMQAHQHKMNHISHNIANVDTTGYKKKDVQFTELLHNTVTSQDVRLLNGMENPSMNTGVKLAASKESFAQGSLIQTNDPLHLAIGGNGFFGVRNEDDEFLLTRDGAFHLNENGRIVNDRGDFLELETVVPAEQWGEGNLAVNETGDVIMTANGQSIVAGTIPLYQPQNSTDLASAGGNTYRVNEGAELLTSDATPQAFGKVVNGYLEQSTVDLAQSFTEMIMSQRAYSLNAKVIQSTDEIYSLINQFS